MVADWPTRFHRGKVARVNHHGLLLSTGLGSFVATFSATGLCRLHFPGAEAPVPPLADVPADWVEAARNALNDVLERREPAVWPPLDLSAGTEFQNAVWVALRAIPWGETRTYGEVARAVGRPQGMRAVGAACGANPLPVLIPCHRVVAAGGRLGGFSGGLDWKLRLLAREGVLLSA